MRLATLVVCLFLSAAVLASDPDFDAIEAVCLGQSDAAAYGESHPDYALLRQIELYRDIFRRGHPHESDMTICERVTAHMLSRHASR